MSNAKGTTTSREEEIAFRVVEQVLGVDRIELADAGRGNRMPDGRWAIDDYAGVLEVTSPPDHELLAEHAKAKRCGTPQAESGDSPVLLNQLGQVFLKVLVEPWAQENVDKLVAVEADDRHLYLLSRSLGWGNYFFRLSDTYPEGPIEQIQDLELPDGLTDVWFQGRARQVDDDHNFEIRVARFHRHRGWMTHIALIEERRLPAPNSNLARDPIHDGWRQTPPDRAPAIDH